MNVCLSVLNGFKNHTAYHREILENHYMYPRECFCEFELKSVLRFRCKILLPMMSTSSAYARGMIKISGNHTYIKKISLSLSQM